MASRKQFHKLDVHGDVSRRNSTVGGTVIGDYMQDGGRIIVVEMPKVEKKAARKPKKQGSSASTSVAVGPVSTAQPVTAEV